MNMHINRLRDSAATHKTIPFPVTARAPRLAPMPNDLPTAISVIGLGYVGAVSMACLSELGHPVHGIDLDLNKVDAINDGRAPIVEAGLEDMLQAGIGNGLISASRNFQQAVADTDVTFVSVGTPTSKDGGCDLSYVEAAARSIGEAIRHKSAYHVVVMRCSVPPGTTMDRMVPEIERASGKTLNKEFGICFNPEFLREGTAVADFYEPPKTVIGASDCRAAEVLAEIYRPVDAKPLIVTIAAAEMVKYVDNVWHATKVSFANETGRFCKALGIDSHEVMNVFVQDQKLNLSPYYLKPGFAFGGSCLPKEVRAMEHLATQLGIKTPLVKSLTPSNLAQVEIALDMIEATDRKKIGFLGVTFKPDTDDLRESPTLDVMARLHDDGYEITAYDPNLTESTDLSSQLNYISGARPELAGVIDALDHTLTESVCQLVGNCDVLVVSHKSELYRQAVQSRRPGTQVIDLVRLFDDLPDDSGYQGISW